ncbi:reverse transcriptase domain-containing protein [Nocardiopsis sp. LOL_012]|uniref:reverse transcriptase domain-containing protein n=1 Tax=Nocardiopsis sp. LOL_012 TaxID=3345409 RepID=UPI003A8A81F4
MSAAPHSLMPLLTQTRWLKRAARACMRRGGAPGPDGLTWSHYREELDTRLDGLAERLADGTWAPVPPRLVSWPGWGKELRVCVPTVEDRIVHRALRQAAEPVLDRDAYPPWLFGWRPRRGRVEAVAAAAAHLTAGRPWVADLDVAKVTSGAQTEEIITALAVHIYDGAFLAVMRTALNALPSPLYPGSGLSPMLTNVRLLGVDRHEALRHLELVRLTDNYTAFTPTPTEAAEAMTALETALGEQGMRPHPEKSKVWRPNPEDLYLAG